MAVHIFVDNSNIFGGAQRPAGTLEPGAVWLSVRVYYPNLFRLLERGRDVRTRVMSGSVPPGNDDLWAYAEKSGYRTNRPKRVTSDDGRLVEQAVDEHLHLAMAHAVLDFKTRPQTLVLATGDGAITSSGGSFEFEVRRALREGGKWRSGRGRTSSPVGSVKSLRQTAADRRSIT